jgi:DNA (cytosine-5)-methyltransferase 1
MNVDHPRKLTHISLCTGYGGIDLGLSRALSGAFRTVCYVEIEAFAVSNLVAQVENGHLDTAPIFTDLKQFPWSNFAGRVDILSGGFPCQPFSAAGRRAGDEDPRHLFPYIVRGIRELERPPIVFLENVEGIISSKLKGDQWSDPEGTPVLLHVLRELERLGYDATAGVFSAREIGAPHQRKRVFIMGCRADLGESGRALVSGLLERGGESSVGYSESRSRKGPSWGREPKLKAVQHSLRESGTGTAYPAPRGAEQYPWEPPRVTMVNTDYSRLQGDVSSVDTGRSQSANSPPATRSGTRRVIQGNIEPPMGGNADGAPSGLGYAELCYVMDNRTDELRLLGNGVVPDTAERAFRTLWGEWGHASLITTERDT